MAGSGARLKRVRCLGREGRGGCVCCTKLAWRGRLLQWRREEAWGGAAADLLKCMARARGGPGQRSWCGSEAVVARRGGFVVQVWRIRSPTDATARVGHVWCRAASGNHGGSRPRIAHLGSLPACCSAGSWGRAASGGSPLGRRWIWLLAPVIGCWWSPRGAVGCGGDVDELFVCGLVRWWWLWC